MRVKTQLTIRFWDAQDNPTVHQDQKVPSIARVAGAFGFLIFNHAFDGPDLYGASSLPIRSEKMLAPSRAIRDRRS